MAMHLQRSLEELNKKILVLGSVVEESVRKAVQAIEQRDSEVAHRARCPSVLGWSRSAHLAPPTSSLRRRQLRVRDVRHIRVGHAAVECRGLGHGWGHGDKKDRRSGKWPFFGTGFGSPTGSSGLAPIFLQFRVGVRIRSAL